MSRFNSAPSAEYSAFKRAGREYAAVDHEPSGDVSQALADAHGDDLRAWFRDCWGVEEPAGGRPASGA